MAHTAVSLLLQKILLIPMVALWVFHLYQRRFKDAAVRKRIATLSLTALIIGAWVAAWVFSRSNVDDIYLVAVAAAVVIIAVWQRKFVFPYRIHCRRCGKPLALMRVLSYDSNTCEACQPPQRKE